MESKNPFNLVRSAVRENSLPALRDLLAQYRDAEPKFVENLIKLAFCHALVYDHVQLLDELLESGASRINLAQDNFFLGQTWLFVTIPILEILLKHGWDVNQHSPLSSLGIGGRLIYNDLVLANVELVRWLVEHNAIIDEGDPENADSDQLPLLDICAYCGSIDSFRFSRERGAKLGKTVLHQVTQIAASWGIDPSVVSDKNIKNESLVGRYEGVKEEDRIRIGAMLRYLVDEVKLDINQIGVLEQLDIGPPLYFAFREPNGTLVAEWLLERGAAPLSEDSFRI